MTLIILNLNFHNLIYFSILQNLSLVLKIYNKSLTMIPQNPMRSKKSYSLVSQKEDKENCSNNIQLQANQGQNKLGKLRESLGQCNQPQKIISSLKIESNDEAEDISANLKKEYSWLVKRDYSFDILKTLVRKNQDISDALKNHLITQHLRAKMVDWMIEVLSSYKMSQQTFFRSVKYMDQFFKKVTRKLQVSDLHLIGVSSMFMASKYEQIYPFKLNTIYDKICRKKFAKRELIDMEQQLLLVLEFQLQKTTCYDIIRHVLDQMNIPLDSKTAQYLHKVSVYLGKMAMHCTELTWRQDKKLAAAVIYIALKTVQQVETSLNSDGFLDIITQLTQIKACQLLQVSQELLSLAKSFHKQYPNLTNLKKFNNAQFVD